MDGKKLAILVVVVLVVGVAVGYVGATLMSNAQTSSLNDQITTLNSQVSTLNASVSTLTDQLSKARAIVNLDIIADWGGSGYDAFIIPQHVNGTVPEPATNVSQPGLNDNNITVRAGVPITFVITNVDTAAFNFSGAVTVPFTVYNDTDSGQVALQYHTGESVNMIATHTFTITSLHVNIPTPPDTITVFTYTFANQGVYEYFCATPCGLGMSVPGYMIGYVIVT
jgi:hypothetical protein